MVFTPPARLGSAYGRIKAAAAAEPLANTVLVLAANDPDALCACKMICVRSALSQYNPLTKIPSQSFICSRNYLREKTNPIVPYATTAMP
ncbi:hypothetical protein HK100_006962, partial [Physocladia obscura]